ncbi:SAM-dependent methyltransferase [Ligilactobacillus equi]|uniref:Eco57I restriction-modification methylase domain-containing protein n=1 Tax=Ligilactobacillus equi TaxID=137357 RepID=UPI002ED65436
MNRIRRLGDIISEYTTYLTNNNNPSNAKKVKELIETLSPEIKINNSMLSSKKTINYEIYNVSDLISDLSEYSQNRKRRGAYYTPKDVISFMVNNTVLKYLSKEEQVYTSKEAYKKILSKPKNVLMNFCKEVSVLDPTCGSGDFLLEILHLKISILKEINELNYANILCVLLTIYGNDMDEFAALATKIRIGLFLVNYVDNNQITELYKSIDSSIYNKDFIFEKIPGNIQVDIIIGNPPYVEYRQLDKTPEKKMGNLYANVLDLSIEYLNPKGIMTYIIPISFTATKRMRTIRSEIFNNFQSVTLLHFADRPASLFQNVHQKLDILIGENKGNKLKYLYTSQYNYFYKNDREKLFDNLTVIRNEDYEEDFIPKYGNSIQKSIYNKVLASYGDKNLLMILKKPVDTVDNNIFLSKRAAFFIKSFLYYPNSTEYTEYSVVGMSNKILYAILNSSLFWYYWNIVSDGWHLVNKDLLHFRIPVITNHDTQRLSELATQLMNRLEETKVYVGTKQTDYEYKHRLAFDILDKIDETVANIYNLTEDELTGVKSYARKYRGG